MALDLYVGPLCRYYAQDWKNLAQQAAEEQGLEYQVVRPEGQENEEGPSQAEIGQIVNEWRDWLVPELEKHGDGVSKWSEDFATDYSTVRPGWDALWALVLKAAYLMRPDLTPPATLPDFETIQNDPAFVAAQEDPSSLHALFACELWLPGEFSFIVTVPMPTGNDVQASSVALLKRCLEDIATAWDIGADELMEFGFEQPGSEDSLDALAKYGWATFAQCVADATERGLPIIMDY